MKAIMLSVWIMILAVLSTTITVPLGLGHISGIAFGLGMIASWLCALCWLFSLVVRKTLSRRSRT